MNELGIKVHGDVKARVPTLYVKTLIVEGVSVGRTPSSLEDRKDSLIINHRNTEADELFSNPLFKAYRGIHSAFNYPRDMLPAVEGMYVRGILRERFPTINSAVDASNVVSAETLIPIGLFDRDSIVGASTLRVSGEGESFTPIGKKKPMSLTAGMPILEDEEKIYSTIGVRDSEATKVTHGTRSLALFSWGTSQVPEHTIEDALRKAAELIKHT
ncbi:hypothetical protein JXL21_08495 [Candidatus Bathyarchaeota archaeon]|nr:hypothetical protein [Candidatus Bathyarchaeota archaeon]